MENKRGKRRVEKTGSEALEGTKGLHFLHNQLLGYTRDIRPEKITTSFYTNTFNQRHKTCQDLGFRLEGVYKRVRNNILLSSSLILKIQERKQVGNKSKMYLALYKKVNGKFVFQRYVSGMKEVKGIENLYRIDYFFEGSKIDCLMSLTATTAKITKIPDFLPLYTNRGKK